MRTEGPTDGLITQVPWTEDLALRAANVNPDASRAAKLAAIRDAIDADLLPPDAVDALIAAGWTELEDQEA